MLEYTNKNNFFSGLKDKQIIICLDVGARKIGIAFSNPEKNIALPAKISNNKDIRKDLWDMQRQYGDFALAIGLPVKMTGEHNPQHDKILKFSKRLAQYFNCPYLFIDERGSTAQANNLLKETGICREKRNMQDDKIAAMIILQSLLDSAPNK